MAGVRGGGAGSNAPATRVLVVDDDPADACVTISRLKQLQRKVQVEVVNAFEPARRELVRGGYDIAFIDHYLGAQTGLELIDLARNEGVECALVLMTGSMDSEVELTALDRGATDFLDKSELTARSLDRTLRYSIQRANEVNQIARLGARLEAIIEGSNDGVWDWSPLTGSLFLSTRFCELIGADPEAPTSLRSWLECIHPDDRARVEAALRAEVVGESDTLEIEYRVVRGEGEVRWMHLRGKGCRAAAGRLQRVAGSQTDITRRKEREEDARHRAFHDPLTGLGNRAALEQQLEELQGLLECHGIGFSLVLLDLDGFKLINDRHGHATGDEVLQEVAARLLRVVSTGGTAARIGGDEFVVVAPGCASFALATELAQSLGEAVARPIEAVVGRVRVGASWGVRVVAEAGVSSATALADADAAMYGAKSSKRRPRAVG
ncbi:MAG: diguanylate cyclase domain-containing protein [Nannocystaceae bacterium]|nr:diguanylate cyclase [bacterium]